MAKDQAILAQLDATAERGIRPERAKAALADVPALPENLFELEEQLTRATDDAEEKLKGAARHLVSAGGKRIRPTVLFLCARAAGYDGPHLVRLGAVLELIHTATLLHDDVVDGADVRRGRPAANHVFGNAASVLVGDYLYSLASVLLARSGHRRILTLVAEATNGMAEGEVLTQGTFDEVRTDHRVREAYLGRRAA